VLNYLLSHFKRTIRNERGTWGAIAASVIGAGVGVAGNALMSGDGGTDEDGNPIKKVSTLSSEQEKLMKGLGDYLLVNVGKGATPYTGQLVAPISQGEQSAYDKSLSNLSGGMTSSAAGSVDAYKKAIAGLSPEEVYSQYMKYTAPSEARYLKDVSIPTFKESMVPGGTLRSTGTEMGIGDIVSKYGEGQLGRIGERINVERTNAINALGQASGINALESGSAAMNEAATYGGLARTIQQADLSAKLEEFKRTTPEASPLIDKMLAYLGISTQAAYNTTDNTTSPFMQLLGAIAPGVGTYLGSKTTTPTTSSKSSSTDSMRNSWGTIYNA